MAESFQVQLSRASSSQPWGFRLQGGADFPTPLSVQSVNPGSIADQCGLKAGDAVLQIGSQATDSIAHEAAKSLIIAGGDVASLLVQRGAVRVWKPKVTPMTELRGQPSQPGAPPSADDAYATKTSLAADKQDSQTINFFNRSARPFGGFGGDGAASQPEDKIPVVVNAQYNTPIGMYSSNSAIEAFDQQSQAMVGGMDGNYSGGQQDYGAPHGQAAPQGQAAPPPQAPPSGMRSVRAPTGPPANVQIQQAQHMTCKACGSLIIGVFVKVKGDPMHAECYKCVRCGKSLKNQGFFNIEGRLHCEPCAKNVSSPPPGSNYLPTAVYR